MVVSGEHSIASDRGKPTSGLGSLEMVNRMIFKH